MRTIEDIERDLKNAQEEAKPIFEAEKKALAKINHYLKELEQFKLNNGIYHPMSDLEQYRGKDVYSVNLVQKHPDGSVSLKIMFGDEMLQVDENGHLSYSSLQGGMMDYSEKSGKYLLQRCGHIIEYDFIGFMDISVDDGED